MDDIDQMSKNLKEVTELQAYADAQYKTILDLSRKLNKLEEENKSLKKQLETGEKPELIINQQSELISSDEELICRTQLSLLKESALGRELSLEEAKKVDIYTKILIALKEKNKKNSEDSTKKLDDKELLKALEEAIVEQK